MVLRSGKKSRWITPFKSQKNVAITFPAEIALLGFFGFWRTAMVPLFHRLLWLRNEMVNPCFISCSPSSSNRPRSWLAIWLHTILFSLVHERRTNRTSLSYRANVFFTIVSTLPTLIFNTEESSFTIMCLLSHISTLVRSILDGVIDVRGRRLCCVFSTLSLSLSLFPFRRFYNIRTLEVWADKFLQAVSRASEEFW